MVDVKADDYNDPLQMLQVLRVFVLCPHREVKNVTTGKLRM